MVLIRAESRSRSSAQPIVGLVLGTFLEPLLAALADPVAHFPRRPLREGDGHQLTQPRPAITARWSIRLQLAQNRSVKTFVFPHPAPADTATDPPRSDGPPLLVG